MAPSTVRDTISVSPWLRSACSISDETSSGMSIMRPRMCPPGPFLYCQRKLLCAETGVNLQSWIWHRDHERKETTRSHRKDRSRHRRLARPWTADRRGAGRNGRETRDLGEEIGRTRAGARSSPETEHRSLDAGLRHFPSGNDRTDGIEAARAPRKSGHPRQQRGGHLGRSRRRSSAGSLAEAGKPQPDRNVSRDPGGGETLDDPEPLC